MEKFLKKFGMLMLVALVLPISFVLSACGDDDDDENPSGGDATLSAYHNSVKNALEAYGYLNPDGTLRMSTSTGSTNFRYTMTLNGEDFGVFTDYVDGTMRFNYGGAHPQYARKDSQNYYVYEDLGWWVCGTCGNEWSDCTCDEYDYDEVWVSNYVKYVIPHDSDNSYLGGFADICTMVYILTDENNFNAPSMVGTDKVYTLKDSVDVGIWVSNYESDMVVSISNTGVLKISFKGTWGTGVEIFDYEMTMTLGDAVVNIPQEILDAPEFTDW